MLSLVTAMPLIVVLDTNILTVPAQFGVDIFKEAREVLEKRLDFIVIEPVVWELEKKLNQASGTEKQKFNIALDLAKQCKIQKVPESERKTSVDRQILDFAKSVGGVIATNDRRLINQAISERIPILFMRSKKRLELRGTIS